MDFKNYKRQSFVSSVLFFCLRKTENKVLWDLWEWIAVDSVVSMSSENDVEMCETPLDIRDAATTVADNLLPEKSRKQYEKSYKDFMDWKTVKKATSFSENVLLVYFQEISTKFKPCTLWTIYSMLKSRYIEYQTWSGHFKILQTDCISQTQIRRIYRKEIKNILTWRNQEIVKWSTWQTVSYAKSE